MLQLKQNKEVDVIISLNDLKRLQKNDSLSTFELTSLLDPSKTSDATYLKERQKECKRIDGEIKKSCEDRNKGDKGYIGR